MNSSTPRSTFVNVVGGIFTALTGMCSLMFLVQAVMFHTLFSKPEMQMALSKPPPGMPEYVALLFSHLEFFMGGMLIFNICFLISSIGLLLRKNWARLAFIAMLCLLIAWNLFGFGLQLTIFSSMTAQFPNGTDTSTFKIMMVVIGIVCGVFAFGFIGLLGWIAKKLLSAPIVAEFQSASTAY